MDLLLIKEGSPEWEYMWNWIYLHPYNSLLSASEVNRWQYKGSLQQGERILHQFSHGSKELVLIGSDKFNSSDISKTIHLK